MESDTKNKQSKDNILKMLQSAFGEAVPSRELSIKELTEGCFNAAYQIVLPDREMILKIAPPDVSGLMLYENNIMRAEVDALRLVKANTTLPVPKVFFYDDTHSICSSDYFFMEKLSGKSFSKMRFEEGMPEDQIENILNEIGRYNAEMNKIKGTCFGYIGQKEKQGLVWRDVFQSMMADILTDGERVEISLGIRYREARKLIDRASFSLDQVTNPQFVHGDLWEGNVFVTDGKISGMIDFERAIWGDPLMENFFRLHCRSASYAKGYGRDLREEAPIRALLYDMYLYLIMVIETKYRNYPDDWQLQFATKELMKTVNKLNELL